MATTEKRKDRSGEAQDVTTWFRISAWGRQAELANQYLAKGRKVYVEGRLREEKYTDREGNERTSLEVNASDVQFLDPRNDSTQSSQAGAEDDQAESGRDGDGETPASAPARSNGRSSRSKRSQKETVEEADIPF